MEGERESQTRPTEGTMSLGHQLRVKLSDTRLAELESLEAINRDARLNAAFCVSTPASDTKMPSGGKGGAANRILESPETVQKPRRSSV